MYFATVPVTTAFRFSVLSVGYLGKHKQNRIGGLLRGDDKLMAEYAMGGGDALVLHTFTPLPSVSTLLPMCDPQARYSLRVQQSASYMPSTTPAPLSESRAPLHTQAAPDSDAYAGSDLVDVSGVDLETYFLDLPEVRPWGVAWGA